MSAQAVEEKLRTVLVVGVTEVDARAFIDDVARRQRVPDVLWPMSETLCGSFAGPAQVVGAADRGYRYDLVFITQAALASMTEEQMNVAHQRATVGTWIEAQAPC